MSTSSAATSDSAMNTQSTGSALSSSMNMNQDSASYQPLQQASASCSSAASPLDNGSSNVLPGHSFHMQASPQPLFTSTMSVESILMDMPIIMKDTSMQRRRELNVYGERLNSEGLVIWLHRLTDGNWVEHDENDTFFVEPNSPYMSDDYLKTVSVYYCTGYPKFYATRARVWPRKCITGLRKGNAVIKEKYFSPYFFE